MRALIIMMALYVSAAANAADQLKVDNILAGTGSYAGVTYLTAERAVDHEDTFVALRCQDGLLEVRVTPYMPGIFNHNDMTTVPNHIQALTTADCPTEIRRMKAAIQAGQTNIVIDSDSNAKTVVSFLAN